MLKEMSHILVAFEFDGILILKARPRPRPRPRPSILQSVATGLGARRARDREKQEFDHKVLINSCMKILDFIFI